MIKVITIDFWNTLFDSSGGNERNALRQKALLQEINNYGRNISPEEFDKALRASWEYFNKIWRQEMRTPSVQDSVVFFWKYLELPTNPEAIERIADFFANSVLIHPPKLIDGVADILPILASNYKLGIISDTGFSPGIVLRKLLEQNNILHFFDSFSFSDETGYSKPHPEAYRKVLSELGSDTSETLHIGDIEATDIIGAKQLGMRAIRFAGDSTGYFANESANPTIADAIVYSWDEIPEAIVNIC